MIVSEAFNSYLNRPIEVESENVTVPSNYSLKVYWKHGGLETIGRKGDQAPQDPLGGSVLWLHLSRPRQNQSRRGLESLYNK
jgi:hypothetical protein